MSGGIITHQANQGGTYKRFPLWMKHPHEQPAVVSDDRQVIDGREVWVQARPGKPIKFGPVMALDDDQEAYFRAQGYVPVGEPDPGAYERITVAKVPADYAPQQFPRMLEDGTIDLGPDAPPPPDNFYPYWLRMPGYEPTLVQNLEEHQDLLKQRGAEPVVDSAAEAEIAELEAKLAALRARKAEHPVMPLKPAAAAEADPAASSTGAPDPAEDTTVEVVSEQDKRDLDAVLEQANQVEAPLALVDEAAETELVDAAIAGPPMHKKKAR